MTPHARMVAAVDALITRRSMDPLAHLALVAADDTPRAPDWIDARLSASVALFDHPLTTRAARRLYAAGMRRREVTHG